MTKRILIVAVGPNNVIGYKDQLIWHSKKDFYHFKTQTLTWPCIFGETTFNGLKHKPLKDRLNIVTSFDCKQEGIKYIENKGAYLYVPSIERALDLCKNYNQVFICGGKSIYKYCIENNLVDELLITKIDSKTILDKISDVEKEDLIYFSHSDEELKKSGWIKEDFDYLDLPEEDDKSLNIKFERWYK